MKQEKLIQKPISTKKFKDEIIPMVFEKFEILQHNIDDLNNTIVSIVGLKKEIGSPYNNAYNPFNLNYYDSGLFFENLLVQFGIDFLTDFRQSPVIKNELHLSSDIVFFVMHEDESSSEFYLRNFPRYGSSFLRKLFKLFENFNGALIKCYNEEKEKYIINNLNYLDVFNATDKLISFCKDTITADLRSDNNVEMVHESYLRELSNNSGLDTTIIFKLHSPNKNNPVSIFKIAIHTESYSFQSYIKLFIWSETSKQWNVLLIPTFDQFGLNPTQLTSIHKPTRKYVDKIIKFCIDFSQNFI